MQDRDILHVPAGVDLDAQHDGPLHLRLAPFLAILRFVIPQQDRRGDDAVDSRLAAGDSAFPVLPCPPTAPASDTALVAVADPAAVAGAAREPAEDAVRVAIRG